MTSNKDQEFDDTVFVPACGWQALYYNTSSAAFIPFALPVRQAGHELPHELGSVAILQPTIHALRVVASSAKYKLLNTQLRSICNAAAINSRFARFCKQYYLLNTHYSFTPKKRAIKTRNLMIPSLYVVRCT